VSQRAFHLLRKAMTRTWCIPRRSVVLSAGILWGHAWT
jgi:hypothetical protein